MNLSVILTGVIIWAPLWTPLVMAGIMYATRRNAIPALIRPWVARITEGKLEDFAKQAEAFTQKTSAQKAEYVKMLITREIGRNPDSWDGIANFLVEYAYQLYKARVSE